MGRTLRAPARPAKTAGDGFAADCDLIDRAAPVAGRTRGAALDLGAESGSLREGCQQKGPRVTKTYLFLLAAILAEIIATTALARSASFTRAVPSLITVAGYAVAFWCLSFPLRVMPTGVIYAIWSGLGIVLITTVAWVWYGQKLDLPAVLGLALILAGVLVVNLFSRTGVH